MAINFPDSPTNGQTYAVGSFTWQYDGQKWVGANVVALDGLYDVTAPTPTSGDFLKWNGTAWVNDNSAVTSISDIPDVSTAYQIGNTGPAGGIIFITPDTVGNSTGMYFEAAPSASQLQRSWATGANQSSAVSGADATAIGFGSQNTIDIVAQSGNVSATSAAAYASGYEYGGFSDWFLPSLDELEEIYAIEDLDPGTIPGLLGSNYWSSTEHSATQAKYENLGDGGQGFSAKSNALYVRPVRAFNSPASGDFLKWSGSYWTNDPINLGTDTTGNSDNITEGTTNLYFTDGRARSALLADNAGTASGIRFIAPNTGTVELISQEATRFVRVTSNAAAGGGKTEIQGSAQILASSSISDPGHLTVAGSVTVGGGVVFEGDTANDYETSLVATDPTADRTITLPNADGTVALAGSIALGTDTTGNYMSDLTQGTGVTITHTPGEGSNATIAIGQAVSTSASVTFANITATGQVSLPSGSISASNLASGPAQAGFRSIGAGSSVALSSNNYNIVVGDLGKLIEIAPAANATVTITSANDANFSVGDRVDLLQTTGTYTVTIQGSGVTVNGYDSALKLQGQWAGATLIKRATNSWVAMGNLTT